jgi:hypothetical protein
VVILRVAFVLMSKKHLMLTHQLVVVLLLSHYCLQGLTIGRHMVYLSIRSRIIEDQVRILYLN